MRITPVDGQQGQDNDTYRGVGGGGGLFTRDGARLSFGQVGTLSIWERIEPMTHCRLSSRSCQCCRLGSRSGSMRIPSVAA
ncbi:hypothetical protein BZL30_2405 [Mycobacterium kansasii]|uniref:Uncharacterized protein n=1 Tax=Mycobacterium kansasii TaxID=1768 RepID=A0A1V3XJM0_MYCKA|nr:hypothetical protein BZL30_2405 [Mycobacterium kansasii]